MFEWLTQQINFIFYLQHIKWLISHSNGKLHKIHIGCAVITFRLPY